MEALRWLQLTDEERNEFLGQGGTGVLSFTATGDDPPVSFPVSYGYDPDQPAFYFRLSFPPDSQKEDLVDRPVSFVSHAQTDEGWRSVVTTGSLEEMADLPYESMAVQGMWAIRIPTVDMFEQPPEEMSFRYFRLLPDSLTGRKEVSHGD